MAAKKPNWRNADDYAFTEGLERAGWAWEFLRRNPEYKSEFKALQDGRSEIRKATPHLRKGADVVEYGPDVISAEEALGMKWGMERAIDPTGDQLPSFFSIYPKDLDWAEAQGFFAADEDDGPVVATPPFVILAFDLSGDIEAQVERAHRILISRAEPQQLSKRRIRSEWTNYLRLLDAGDEVPTQEIIACIPEFQDMSNEVETGYRATDTVSDRKNSARRLRDDPLSILGKKSTQFHK